MQRRWRTSEAGAVELAAILEADQPTRAVREGQWQMENATVHVRLKRKLMGLDSKPIVKATVRPNSGRPAPELRKAPLREAGIAEDQIRAIEAKLDQWYADSKEPMAVVIAQNGVIVLAKGYGSVDGEPVTIGTPMLLHSAMKPLIGLQLAMYVDQGLIKLDEPIGNYLPDFNTPQDRKLTFRAGHVHATGIHFPWELAFRRLFYFHTWHESLIAHCRREWAPGAKHRYGVVGVILSVRALELLRGRNYWDAMERDLFEPLGIRNVLPGGTGFSAESMARIGVVLANRGTYGNHKVISEQTYQAIIPTALKPYFPALNMRYGIGLQDHSQQPGPGSFGHGGGCGTLLTVNPAKHLVFAMVRNGQGKDYKKCRSEVLSLLRK
jgi:CubicO group peptidase (beta-lactamase class C family)